MSSAARVKVFDAHLHIIDPRFPLAANQGYLPAPFTVDDYRARVTGCDLRGGAVVAASFQGTDPAWLHAVLRELGPGFVGVASLGAPVTDEHLLELDRAGVRALRVNLYRGGPDVLQGLDRLARQVDDVVGWHVELYVDGHDLDGMYSSLAALPAVCIDHLGLHAAGRAALLHLAERGMHVKATGFGRVDFDVPALLRDLYAANPAALLFGTDLPSTRAPRPYLDSDLALIADTLGEAAAADVLYRNAVALYRPATVPASREAHGA